MGKPVFIVTYNHKFLYQIWSWVLGFVVSKPPENWQVWDENLSRLHALFAVSDGKEDDET